MLHRQQVMRAPIEYRPYSVRFSYDMSLQLHLRNDSEI